MKNKYSGRITTLLDQVRPKLAATHRIEFKNVFGAVGGYVDGRIFISCGTFGIALRLPPNVLEVLFEEQGARRLRYFPKGHIKKEYAVIPGRILKDASEVGRLLDESVRYVLATLTYAVAMRG